MKSIDKLIDTVKGAVGKLYEPVHQKRKAKASAEEIKLIAQVLRENTDLPITYKSENILINTENFEELVQRAQNRLAYQELTKQQNIESVTDKAYDILSSDIDCSPDPVSQDWITRFYNSVEDVSDEKMQELWAKILAGEIKSPGNFSLRTLDLMSKISQDEAKLFQKILPFVVVDQYNRYLIVTENDFILKYGVTIGDILVLEECGLLFLSETMQACFDIADSQENYLRSKNIIVKLTGRSADIKTIDIGVHTLSRSGRELLKVLDWCTDDKYLLDVVDYMFTKYHGIIKPVAYNILSASNNSLKIDKENPVKIW